MRSSPSSARSSRIRLQHAFDMRRIKASMHTSRGFMARAGSTTNLVERTKELQLSKIKCKYMNASVCICAFVLREHECKCVPVCMYMPVMHVHVNAMRARSGSSGRVRVHVLACVCVLFVSRRTMQAPIVLVHGSGRASRTRLFEAPHSPLAAAPRPSKADGRFFIGGGPLASSSSSRTNTLTVPISRFFGVPSASSCSFGSG